jgi:hypothetical protein
MWEELEARIRKLEAIEEIKNLQARYSYFIDSFQGEKLIDLFADNFIAEYEPGGTYRTKEELLGFIKVVRLTNVMMCHQAMTPLIEVDGDKAKGTWYLFGPLIAITPQGEVAVWEQGKYEHEYVRVDGKWKFSHFKVKLSMLSPYEDGWAKTPIMNRPEYPEGHGFHHSG